MSKYRKLAKYPNYVFDENGSVYNLTTGLEINRIIKDDIQYFQIEKNKKMHLIRCDYFLAEAYFGYPRLNLPIIFKDNNPNNLSSVNMYYAITELIQAQFDCPYTEYLRVGGQLFKRCDKYPQYFISEFGLVYSTWWGKIKLVTIDKDGYAFIKLATGNSNKDNCRISRLVYETFIGEIAENFVIDHYNGKIYNNHVSNLNAISGADNSLKGHTFDNKRHLITDELCHKICKFIQDGKSIDNIYAIIGNSNEFSTLQSFANFCLGLVRGLYYRNISAQYDLRNFHFGLDVKRKYKNSQIEDVCKMIDNGYSKTDISIKLGIPMAIIKNIYGRNSWKEISNKYNFSKSSS